MRTRLGAPKAITATAHKLAKIMYFLLENNVEFVDMGAEYYEIKYKQRVLKNLSQRATKLGYTLVPAASVS